MPLGANKRATPSAVMMNGRTASGAVGSAVRAMSGTSAPPQDLPFHDTSGLSARHGLPVVGLTEAPLYKMRRLAGHDQAQPSVCPMFHGSLLSRRAIWLPACVQAPQ